MTIIEPYMEAGWRTGYDSTDPAGIPADAKMVFPYVAPSMFAWSDREIDRFKDASVVRITVHGAEPDWRHASIIDVETGAFTPWQAREFIHRRNSFRPGTATVYCNRSTLPSVRVACRGLSYHVWLADWTGMPHAVPGVEGLVAVQYKNEPGYDLSVVLDPDWHRS